MGSISFFFFFLFFFSFLPRRLELSSRCQQVGLQSYLVQDAGRTQIAAGSRTVLGVGPGELKKKMAHMMVIERVANRLV